MNFGIIHSIYTVALLIVFLGIVFWAYSKKRKQSFAEAANLVFADEPGNPNNANAGQGTHDDAGNRKSGDISQ